MLVSRLAGPAHFGHFTFTQSVALASGEPPLARAKDWLHLPDGSIRETNTMPQWAGSCWYYLRYLDAKNGTAFVNREVESYWMGSAPSSKSTPGVDLYVGGT